MRRRSSVPPDLGFPLPTLLLISALLSLKQRVEASIHAYQNEAFIPGTTPPSSTAAARACTLPRFITPKDVADETPLYGKSYIRKFTNSLATSVLFSIAWIGYEFYFNATNRLGEMWRRAWIIPAVWTGIICMLWAPSNNPTRFAYAEETGDDEEEGVLLGSGLKTAADVAIKLERNERKASGVADNVFGLAEDLVEDKRECLYDY